MSENSSSEDLMTVILAMSGSERRYFRLSMAQRKQEGSDMMALYDHLLEVGKWDDSEIKRHFQGAAFLRQLAVARTRLQQAILGALRAYDHGRSFQAEFSRRLDEIDLLYRRKLWAPCLRLAQNAQRRAEALQLPLHELGALTWCLRLLRQLARPDMSAHMQALHTRHALVTIQIAAESQLLQCHDGLMALLQHPSPTSQRLQAEALWTEIQAIALPATLHLDARLLLHYAEGYYALILQDAEAYWQSQRNIVDHWEAVPDRLAMEEERTFRIYVSYAESAVHAHRLEEVPRVIEKLRRLLARSETLRPVENARILLLELAHLTGSAQQTEAAAMVPSVEAFVQAMGAQLSAPTRLSLLANGLSCLFKVGDWPGVLRLGLQLQPALAGSGQMAVAALAWWTGLVAHYELLQHAAVEQALRLGARPQEQPLTALFMQLLECRSPAEERTVKRRLAEAAKALAQRSTAPHLDLLEQWAAGNVHASER